jgi:hypothetical protein
MAFDIPDNTRSELEAIASRSRAKTAEMNALIAEAKGGNPRKLISYRDLHSIAFARLSEQLSPRGK